METQSQASSAAEKKKRVETIVATKGSSARADVSEKAVASSTTSNDPLSPIITHANNGNSEQLCVQPQWLFLLRKDTLSSREEPLNPCRGNPVGLASTTACYNYN
ncbi:hypothetical protein DPEC_G00069990 [Dallia pectoralis]|uniref:Uncharacterized protein n=1 Tax=Dallia pectoralis TaxID=75939 RepID=A0ACC2H1Z8_DALPE|nr:hypothetical protein DPEC_G00069990 [Dallia pectoralis]